MVGIGRAVVSAGVAPRRPTTPDRTASPVGAPGRGCVGQLGPGGCGSHVGATGGGLPTPGLLRRPVLHARFSVHPTQWTVLPRGLAPHRPDLLRRPVPSGSPAGGDRLHHGQGRARSDDGPGGGLRHPAPDLRGRLPRPVAEPPFTALHRRAVRSLLGRPVAGGRGGRGAGDVRVGGLPRHHHRPGDGPLPRPERDQRPGRTGSADQEPPTAGLGLHQLRGHQHRPQHRKPGILGLLVGALLRAGWMLASFFVVPVILFEDKGAIASIKRSVQLCRSRWGENIVGNGALGVIAIVAIMVDVLVSVVLGSVFAPLGAVVGIIGLAAILLVLTVATAAFNAALYWYAVTNQSPGQYSVGDLQSAYRRKGPEGGCLRHVTAGGLGGHKGSR